MQQRPIVWAVMPVKQLSRAKSRLESALGIHRPDFAKSLMLHTFDTLQAACVFDGIVVVTPDAQVASLAEAKGAVIVADDGASLDTACALGLAATRTRGADLTVLVHADLALLSPADMRALLASYHAACAQAETALLGLVRCKDGDGTNVVFCDRAMPFVPHFGPQSFERHAAEGEHRGLINENAAFDIDTEADLARLLGQLGSLDPSDPVARMLGSAELMQTRNDLLCKQL